MTYRAIRSQPPPIIEVAALVGAVCVALSFRQRAAAPGAAPACAPVAAIDEELLRRVIRDEIRMALPASAPAATPGEISSLTDMVRKVLKRQEKLIELSGTSARPTGLTSDSSRPHHQTKEAPWRGQEHPSPESSRSPSDTDADSETDTSSTEVPYLTVLRQRQKQRRQRRGSAASTSKPKDRP